MTVITFPYKGKALPFTVTLTDTTAAALDLTGAAVSLELERMEGAAFTQPGTVTQATTGKCIFTLQDTGALSIPGRFRARVVCTTASQTFPSTWFVLNVE